MKVFLTGATGYIGSAVAERLLAAGHAVVGLARSEQAAATLEARGIIPHRGDLTDPESLYAAARAADAVIQLAQAQFGAQRRARAEHLGRHCLLHAQQLELRRRLLAGQQPHTILLQERVIEVPGVEAASDHVGDGVGDHQR